MNPFAGLIKPMEDRPCIDRREKPRAAVPQWPPRRDLPVIATPWKLTPLQCEVMKLRGQGVSAVAIAEKLKVGRARVYAHLDRVQEKMGVATNRAALDLWDRWVRARQETNQ